MSQYVLTIVDLTGIQKYIFSSSNLKHIIGASELVYRATRQWVYKTLLGLGTSNITAEEKIQETQKITDGNLTSELMYAGGGNAVIIFKDIDIARQFAQKLTRRALVDAPGLEPVICHTPFEWGRDSLSKMVDDTFKELGKKKQYRYTSAPVLGLSVTATCQFTEAPATGKDGGKPISAEIEAKLAAAPLAHHRMIQQAGWPQDYSAPTDFDHFGRTRDKSSYIAVVHADGNGVGQRIQNIAQGTYSDPYRDYIKAMRDFSTSLEQAAIESLKATVAALAGKVKDDQIEGVIQLERDDKEQKLFLPFRPLVFGGDDVTFVCDGRLGLTLAAFYLDHFTRQHSFSPDDKPIYARAGVAVVKTHFPFVRAYQLAEQLAVNAKKYIKDNHGELSVLDWHFASGGPVFDLVEIRRREYEVPAGNLTMRPVRVVGEADDWQSWANFSLIVKDFLRRAQEGESSKIKALREALRGGEDQVKAFLKNYDFSLPLIRANKPHLMETGWADGRCGYFDAIEAMDFLAPVSAEEIT